MTRRTAMATAGALTIVLLAAAAAVATNLGLLRVTGDDGPAGRLSPADLAPTAVVQDKSGAGATEATDGVAADDGTGAGLPGGHDRSNDLGHDDRHPDEHFQGRNDDD